MSQNVEMVRRAIDSVNRGYFRPTKETADDFEMDWSNSIGPLSGVYRGPEQVNEVLKSFREAWDHWQWEPQEMVDLDGDQVLVVNRIRMRGRASRVEVQATGVQVWTIRNGKLASVKLYQSKADALEAVGLSEQDAHADS
jgi:ketosteroid isomerase-like protein